MRAAKLLAEALRLSRPPKLEVRAGEALAYGGLVVPEEEDLARARAFWGSGPENLESWCAALLSRLEQRFPGTKSASFFGVWGGNPARKEFLLALEKDSEDEDGWK